MHEDQTMGDTLQQVAPRPLATTELHDTEKEVENLPIQYMATSADEHTLNLPLALRHTRREPRPTEKLKDSLEYLQQPFAHLADSNNDVPKTYNQAMKRPDLWLESMTKEIEMLKAREVFKIVPRPQDKNVVGSKWVYVVKWKENGELCYDSPWTGLLTSGDGGCHRWTAVGVSSDTLEGVILIGRHGNSPVKYMTWTHDTWTLDT